MKKYTFPADLSNTRTNKNSILAIKQFSLLFLLCLCLTGCSGVSQKDYDSLKKDYDNLNEDYKKLQSAKDSLAQELIESSNVFSDDYITIGVWAEVAFGDNALYSEVGTKDNYPSEYFQVIVPSNYTVESTQEIFDELKLAASSLNLIDVNYKVVSVKYLAEDNSTILDFSFKNTGNGHYALLTISGDLTKAPELASGLHTTLQ